MCGRLSLQVVLISSNGPLGGLPIITYALEGPQDESRAGGVFVDTGRHKTNGNRLIDPIGCIGPI